MRASASRPRAVRSWLTGDRAALTFIVLVVVAAFSPAWSRGELFYESDTIAYYGPFADYAAETLSQGALPLWNPFIYMGYPQFADGETGVLFPLHFVALVTGHVDWLLLWGPVVRALAATFAAYWLARTLGQSPGGATVAGLAFGLGSFSVAQQHHLNIANSIFVLPAMIAALERAIAAGSARVRLRWIGFGGIVFALALLGVHPQMVMIVVLGVVLHVAFSLAVGRWTAAIPVWWRRLGWVVGGGILMGVVGVGVAALQVVPLYELIVQSLRGVTISAAEASRFALLPWASAQLVFPQIMGTSEAFWGPWNRWETSFYVGALPLCLALLALARWRTRTAWTLATVAIVAWLLAHGLHGPVGLYDLLRLIPGFDRARAPGRFTLIALLSLAMLAGFGLDALRDRRLTWRWPAALALLPLLAWAGLLAVNAWVGRDPGTRFETATWADGLPGSSSVGALRPADELVLAATDPWLIGNWLPIAAAAFAFVMIAGIVRAGASRLLVVPVLLLLASTELVFFAATFHPRLPVEAVLEPPIQAAMATQPGQYPRTVLLGEIPDGSNFLLSSRIAEASGYASLVPRRQATLLNEWYEAPARYSRLLGAERVFYSTDPSRGFDANFAEAFGVRYSILRPAVVLDAWSPEADGRADLSADGVPTRLLAIISMQGGTDVPQGATVAVLEWMWGEETLEVRELKAGVELSERTGFGALGFRTPAHSEAGGPSIVIGDNRDSIYHLVTIDAPQVGRPDTVRFRVVRRDVQLTVHGLALDLEDEPSRNLWMPSLEIADAGSDLLVGGFDSGERVALHTRVQLAGDADDALAILRRRDPGYPWRPVVEAGAWGPGLSDSLLATARGPAATATLEQENPTRLVIRTESSEPGMLVIRDAYDKGWKAYVDGAEAPVLPTDLASRGVPIPAGGHEIVLLYDPPAVRLGAMISAISIALVSIAGLGLWRGPEIVRRLGWFASRD